VLRLDQTAALFEVLKAAERGEPSPEEGSQRIRQIVDMRARFGASVTIVGHVVLTVGICLVLQPTRGDLALAALFGALVAAFKRVGGRWTSVQMIMPVAAAFAVSAITFLLAGQGWAEADLRAMIAPLVTFLPGAALTMAVVEFSAAEMITGASRLVAGRCSSSCSGSGSWAPPRWWACPRRMHWLTPRPTSSAGGLPG
jgi:uncharacterized membrane protein YjjP (DUF1212 family)